MYLVDQWYFWTFVGNVGHKGIPSQSVSDVKLWSFICWKTQQPVGETVKLPVIWDAVTLARRHASNIDAYSLPTLIYISVAK